MKRHQTEAERQNMARTGTQIDAGLTQSRSRTVHDEFELIDKDGFSHGSFKTVKDLVEYVEKNFSGQEQDEDRTGRGWDCQVVGADHGR